ncbi:MAG TPA: magnesium transporter, partial [Bacillota bacterium]|nr:magnesium transporter [Bacillota bacterium]
MPLEQRNLPRNGDALSLVRNFLDNPSYRAYKELASGALPADIAEALKSLSEEECRRLLTLLPSELTADIFQELDIPLQVELFGVLGIEKTADIVSEMDSDDAADLLLELNKDEAESILSNMEEDAEAVKDLLKYEEDSSGGIMASEYVALNENWDVTR